MLFQTLGFNPIISRNLKDMGFRAPRPIQAETAPHLIEGRDLIGLARTGTGKTAAYLAPIGHHLLQNRPPPSSSGRITPMSRLRAIVICPTRELAEQVAGDASRILAGSVLRVGCAYGKVSRAKQAGEIARGIDLLVVTPGRCRELIEAGELSLAHVKHIVIDEADRMMDMGFRPQVEWLLSRAPQVRQTMLFTATMPKDVEAVAGHYLNEAVRIEIDRHTTTVDHITQFMAMVANRDKVPLLLHWLSERDDKGVLVFCRTRRRVGWVGAALRRHDHAVGMIHGDKSQAQRSAALERFEAGKHRIVVATDVAARGLHIKAARSVINYDVPLTPEEYVHRIGRAQHGGTRPGEAYTFIADRESDPWNAILEVVQPDVRLWTPNGFEPSVPQTESIPFGQEVPEKNERRASKRNSQRRSRRSRPIGKGQKPGGGVRRPPKD